MILFHGGLTADQVLFHTERSLSFVKKVATVEVQR